MDPAVLQRVKSASVTVNGELISSIGKGLLVLAAVAKNDTAKDVEAMAGKILKAKLWDAEDGGRVGSSVHPAPAGSLLTGCSGSAASWTLVAKCCVVRSPPAAPCARS